MPTLLLGLLSISARAEIIVTDDLGDQLILTQPAKSIIALSPHLTELVFEAGAGSKLIARVDHADFPPEAEQIKSLGSFNNWNIEQVLALQPDLVLIWLTANGETPVKRLRQLGLNVYVSEPRVLSDISQTIRDIGVLANTSSQAEVRADNLDRGIDELRSNYSDKKLVDVFYQVWSEPLITINGEQLISKVIKLCGGRNVFADLNTLAPVITREGLLLANPQIIIGGAQPDDHQSWLDQWQEWPEIDAVKSDNLYFINPDLLNRQTARMLAGARKVCEYIQRAR